MTAPAKFLFNVDFGPGPKPEERTVPAALHEAAVAEAEARGYRNGVSAAEAQARTEAERRVAAAFERIAAAVETLGRGLSAIENRLEAEAVDVALAVARKLAPALIAREPFAEISALVTECFGELVNAPHVVVRINEGLYAAARERLDEIAHARGFEGRLVVLGEPDVALGDCRIEWADGGINRDRAATERSIAEAVERYVAVRRNGAADA
jgi:flagellar assembly protein FliH